MVVFAVGLLTGRVMGLADLIGACVIRFRDLTGLNNNVMSADKPPLFSTLLSVLVVVAMAGRLLLLFVDMLRSGSRSSCLLACLIAGG